MRATRKRLCSPSIGNTLLNLVAPASLSAVEQLAQARSLLGQKQSPASTEIRLFPSWGLVHVPNLTGRFRGEQRGELSSSSSLLAECRQLICDKPAAVSTDAVIVGCRSRKYIERQLLHSDRATHCVVVDHDWASLVDAAFHLRPRYGHCVSFVRCEAAIYFRYFAAAESADVIVFAMPVPHTSKQASHRRLLVRDVFTLSHQCLRVRQGPADPRGVVAFTDLQQYAEFAAEQLEESKLVVAWARKKSDTFLRWLPLPDDDYPKLKGEGLTSASSFHAVCAAKSAATTPLAVKVIAEYDFSRRYYAPLRESDA